MLDTLDCHSSPEEAARAAARAEMDTLVLAHYFPPLAAGDVDEYRAQAAKHFEGVTESATTSIASRSDYGIPAG